MRRNNYIPLALLLILSGCATKSLPVPEGVHLWEESFGENTTSRIRMVSESEILSLPEGLTFAELYEKFGPCAYGDIFGYYPVEGEWKKEESFDLNEVDDPRKLWVIYEVDEDIRIMKESTLYYPSSLRGNTWGAGTERHNQSEQDNPITRP